MTLRPRDASFNQSSPKGYSMPQEPSLPNNLTMEPVSCHGPGLSEVRFLQNKYFLSGATHSYEFRVQQLQALRAAIRRYEPQIMAALQADLGRSPSETFLAEIGFLYDEIRLVLAELKTWMKPEKVATPLLLAPARSQIISEPLGKVLLISPWNYPFQLLMAPVIGAIAAGNCMVLKPSELSPNASKVISKLVNEVFRVEYITVFEGGVETSEALLEQQWDHIFFTGSTAVGRVVAQAAANFLTPVTLELGGKSPVIVDRTANLKIAAKRIVFGKFINAGQTCIAPDYVLVDSSKRDELIGHIKNEIINFYGRDPQASESYSRVINAHHFDRLDRLLEDGTVVFGGRRNRDDLYIEPSIIVDVNSNHAIMQEEIFGPILPILSFESLEDITSQVRSLAKPLALYLFSEDKVMRAKVFASLSFGGGAINDTVMHFLNSNMPFGGVGPSGMGAAHGRNSFLTFSHRKSVLTNTSKIDLPVRYAPYQNYKSKIFRLLMDREQSFGKILSMVLLSAFFILAGIAHFTNPSFYLEMMPPAIPFHKAMVFISGVFEIALGVLILLPKWRSLAAWSLIALLIAVFPANIYMFANPQLFPDLPSWAHYVRLPFQAVFIYWAYSFTKKT